MAEANVFRVIDKLPGHVNLKDKNQTMLRDDEVLLSYDSISSWHFFENKEYDDYIYDKTLELITEFALTHFNEIKEDFKDGNSTYQDYATYIFLKNRIIISIMVIPENILRGLQKEAILMRLYLKSLIS